MAAADNLAFQTIYCLVDGYAYIAANLAFGSPYCRWLCLYYFRTSSLISPKPGGDVVLLLRSNGDHLVGLYSPRSKRNVNGDSSISLAA